MRAALETGHGATLSDGAADPGGDAGGTESRRAFRDDLPARADLDRLRSDVLSGRFRDRPLDRMRGERGVPFCAASGSTTTLGAEAPGIVL